MRKSGGSRGGPSAQVEVSSPPMSVGEGELTSRLGIRGRGMAAEVRKVWLSCLVGGPQIACGSGR